MKNFTVYSKDGCPYCQQILEVLGISELNYVEYKLDEDFTKEAFYGYFNSPLSKHGHLELLNKFVQLIEFFH